MKFERRENKDGTVYYRFVYTDSKTNKIERLGREDVRKRFGKDITTEAEARECLKLLEAKYESEKRRIEKRLTWEKEFYNFAGLLDLYTEKQRKRAPNSWKNNVFYLRHYVLYYFLQEARVNNIDSWPDNFERFRDWLEKAIKVRGKGVIARSSMNHAIKSLNTFLDHLEREKIITFSLRCESFGEHLLNARTIDDVVKPEEMELIYQELTDMGHKYEALLYRFLYFSGMRFNEALAISVGDLYQGEIGNEFLKKKMHAYGMKYFGYVVAEGQFGNVESSGHVVRLPFKGRKKIQEKENRVIPITDKTLWNLLVERAEALHDAMAKGITSKDLLLFPGIDDSTATNHLLAAYERKKLKWRSWHCLRHSRATYLIGETSDTMLARIWLGHSSPRTIERYNHLYQALVRDAKGRELTGGKEFRLKKAE